jgi:hypothetical protein
VNGFVVEVGLSGSGIGGRVADDCGVGSGAWLLSFPSSGEYIDTRPEYVWLASGSGINESLTNLLQHSERQTLGRVSCLEYWQILTITVPEIVSVEWEGGVVELAAENLLKLFGRYCSTAS